MSPAGRVIALGSPPHGQPVRSPLEWLTQATAGTIQKT